MNTKENEKYIYRDVVKENARDEEDSWGCVCIGSSVNRDQIVISKDFAHIGSSGDFAHIESSGDLVHIGSSGDAAKIESSGDFTHIVSCGTDTKIESSGKYATIGSSGVAVKIGSSGDYAKIGSSGYSDQIGSSGHSAQIGSSGDSAKIEAKGKNSIAFACGNGSIIKGKKGTWISLAEYATEGIEIPIFAKSAQIGNKEYLDYKGRILNEEYYYILINKKFTPLIIADGSKMVVLSKKKANDITIYKTTYLSDFLSEEKNKKAQYVVSNGEFNAHGQDIKEAMEDLQFKILKSKNVKEHIERICKQGFMTANDYRVITGACRYGINKWLAENGYTWEDKKPIEEVLELVKGEYGYEKIKNEFEKYISKGKEQQNGTN